MTSAEIFTSELNKNGFECSYTDGVSSIANIKSTIDKSSTVLMLNASVADHRYARLGQIYGHEILYDALFDKMMVSSRDMHIHENADDVIVIGYSDAAYVSAYVCAVFGSEQYVRATAPSGMRLQDISSVLNSIEERYKESCYVSGRKLNKMIKAIKS